MPESTVQTDVPVMRTDAELLGYAQGIRTILLTERLAIDDCLTILGAVLADVCVASSRPCESLTAAANAAHATIHQQIAEARMRSCAEGVGHG